MFVPIPNLPAELAAVVHLAGAAFDAHAGGTAPGPPVWNCRNGRLLVRSCSCRSELANVVLDPLHHRREAVILSPPLPAPPFNEEIRYQIEYLPVVAAAAGMCA
ncbi:hypothetical protein BAE44_0012790 [Dichanthelium oligosanthes]|uniref:Uncharacterized protein n=1 Tax=Dichanthelium oligosanthes TaxID=888268 RepID=A0A1E5VM36_9POAL|nr:hypothetical protein BAE44_0012790 [Dichanthelium oligosanthes]